MAIFQGKMGEICLWGDQKRGGGRKEQGTQNGRRQATPQRSKWRKTTQDQEGQRSPKTKRMRVGWDLLFFCFLFFFSALSLSLSLFLSIALSSLSFLSSFSVSRSLYLFLSFWSPPQKQQKHPKKTNRQNPRKTTPGSEHTSIYIYIYIYAVKLLTGPRFGVFNSYQLGHLMVTNWATSFSHYKNRGFRRFFGAQLSFCVFFVSNYFSVF